jgi:hypothetical protein
VPSVLFPYIQTRIGSDLLMLLKGKDSTVAASSARLFCALATQYYVKPSFSWDGFSEAILFIRSGRFRAYGSR